MVNRVRAGLVTCIVGAAVACTGDADSGLDAGSDALRGASITADAGAPERGPSGTLMTVSWDLERLGGGAVTCAEAQTPIVQVTVYYNRSTRSTTRLPCADRSGAVALDEPGDLLVEVALLDAQDRPVSAATDTFTALPATQAPLSPLRFQVQSMEVSWLIARAGATPRQPITCADAGAASFAVRLGLPGETPTVYSFPCDGGQGRTGALRTGEHQVQFALVAANGAAVTQTGPAPLQIPATMPAKPVAVEFALAR